MHVVCPRCDTVNRLPPDKPALAGKCGHCHAALFEGHPVALTAERFAHHAEKGDLPLLIDFWAEWCGPCRMMAPAFEQAARALEPHVRLVKVNTDEEQRLAGRFRIQGIPTLVLLHRGQEVARTSGAMPANALVSWTRGKLGL
ncbi:thioredoxin TrxC [Azospirillum halopraeferens]|uniref:thioredoxin TrxC n=1 Tax=Azospirillum halopraeferens TaxID=34010 RepID=UPI0004023D64|nr:thioredoxin TrxC [Azospirillum halopraeferens]